MMLRNTRWIVLAAFAALAAGCASSKPRDGSEPDPGASAGVNEPSQLLRRARDLQSKEGCAKAVPVYRIVSGYGEDYDVAQHELGACLLEMTGESDAETSLFRQEALFWLNRAAWAGNPRAQGKLAEILSGAPRYAVAHVEADPQQALVWSIIYSDNSVRDTYGLKATPPLVSDHLQSTLPEPQKEAAQVEAAGFRKIVMSGFEPMADESDQMGEGQQRNFRSPPTDRRRPRQ